MVDSTAAHSPSVLDGIRNTVVDVGAIESADMVKAKAILL